MKTLIAILFITTFAAGPSALASDAPDYVQGKTLEQLYTDLQYSGSWVWEEREEYEKAISKRINGNPKDALALLSLAVTRLSKATYAEDEDDIAISSLEEYLIHEAAALVLVAPEALPYEELAAVRDKIEEEYPKHQRDYDRNADLANRDETSARHALARMSLSILDVLFEARWEYIQEADATSLPQYAQLEFPLQGHLDIEALVIDRYLPKGEFDTEMMRPQMFEGFVRKLRELGGRYSLETNGLIFDQPAGVKADSEDYPSDFDAVEEIKGDYGF